MLAGILICCMLLAAVMPTAFAVITEISAVELGDLTEPVAGATPDFDVTTPDAALYLVRSVQWLKYDDTGAQIPMSETDTFAAGESYEVNIMLDAGNVSFKLTDAGAPAVDATLNGAPAKVAALATVSPDRVISVSKTFRTPAAPSVTVITEAAANDLTLPVENAAPDFAVTVPEGAAYTVKSVEWFKIAATSDSFELIPLGASDAYEADEDYRVIITFTANDGYAFGPNADGVLMHYIDGGMAWPATSITNDARLSEYAITNDYTAEAAAPPVNPPSNPENEISVMEANDLTLPEAGASPDFDLTVPSGAAYTVSNVVWERFENGDPIEMDADDVFEGEGEYQVTITFAANVGTVFVPNENDAIVGKVNGDTAMPATSITNDSRLSEYSVWLYFYVDAAGDDRTAITEVSVTDLAYPSAGLVPDTAVSVPADAKYSVAEVVWSSLDTGAALEEGEIVVGGEYLVTITLRADDDAYFTANENGAIGSTINGEPAMPVTGISDGEKLSEYTISYVYTVYEMLECIEEPVDPAKTRLRFRASGDFRKFIGLRLNGVLLERSLYTAESGSTIVTLDAEFSKKLAEGTHTLTFLYTDGSVSTNFTIAKKAPANTQGSTATSPDTGDPATLAWAALLAMSSTGAAVVLKKKKR
ncbi:MAG: hypothetical protein IIY16_07240 [Oscillospiraceae bacterium]|nr:hypothetical protein [Oscillospiraceae bacterium]